MGGRGGSGGSYAGVSITRNGKTTTYILRNGQLQNAQTLSFMPNTNKETLSKMISAGGKALTNKDVKAMQEQRNKERANTPDYELGNPFGERGKKKLVYRPRRGK